MCNNTSTSYEMKAYIMDLDKRICGKKEFEQYESRYEWLLEIVPNVDLRLKRGESIVEIGEKLDIPLWVVKEIRSDMIHEMRYSLDKFKHKLETSNREHRRRLTKSPEAKYYGKLKEQFELVLATRLNEGNTESEEDIDTSEVVESEVVESEVVESEVVESEVVEFENAITAVYDTKAMLEQFNAQRLELGDKDYCEEVKRWFKAGLNFTQALGIFKDVESEVVQANTKKLFNEIGEEAVFASYRMKHSMERVLQREKFYEEQLNKRHISLEGFYEIMSTPEEVVGDTQKFLGYTDDEIAMIFEMLGVHYAV